MSTQRPIVNLDTLIWPANALQATHLPPPVERLALPGVAWRVRGLLASSEVGALARYGHERCTTAVGHDGILAHYHSGDAVGSYRASTFSPELAALLWQRLSGLPWPTEFGAFDHVDWEGTPHWTPDGVNPLLRFIQYRPSQGELVAHYDAPYVQSRARRTLYTLLLYLSDNREEGHTRFIRDAQDSLAFEQRDFSDWSRVARPDEVLLENAPQPGDALVFEHRLLHDSQPVMHTHKLVARSDIFFSRVDSGTKGATSR